MCTIQHTLTVYVLDPLTLRYALSHAAVREHVGEADTSTTILLYYYNAAMLQY